jgi:hypothetical protein
MCLTLASPPENLDVPSKTICCPKKRVQAALKKFYELKATFFLRRFYAENHTQKKVNLTANDILIKQKQKEK